MTTKKPKLHEVLQADLKIAMAEVVELKKRNDYLEERQSSLLQANSQEVERGRGWRKQLTRQVEVTESLIDRCLAYHQESLRK